MALVSCPECAKEVSDKSGKCIHCGYPLDTPSREEKTVKTVAPDSAKKTKVESIVRQGVDFIFGLLYLYFIYAIFFTDELGDDVEGFAFYFGIAIAFAILYFIHKLIRAVLGTIGGMFDSVSDESNS